MANTLEDVRKAKTRAKVARYRSRKALQEFTSTELRVAQNLASGLNGTQALVQAGSNARSVQSLARGREALQAIKDKLGLTLEYTVAKVMELCEASKPMLTADGCIETPAWDARGKGVGYSIGMHEASGEIPKAQAEEHQGTTISYTTVLGNLIDVSQRGAEKAKRHKRKAAKPATIDLNTLQSRSDNR